VFSLWQKVTKWVKFYESDRPEKGYNLVLPGTVPSKYKNKEPKPRVPVINPVLAINKRTGEVREFQNANRAAIELGLKSNKVFAALSYWKSESRKLNKCVKGWIFIRQSEYNPEFNYIKFKKKSI